MLTIQILEEFMQRIGVDDFDFGHAQATVTGDLVTAFDPDTSFDDVVTAVNKYRPFAANITDNGQNFVEVQDTIYINGVQTRVSYLCTRGDMGYGTMVKVMVKSVTCSIKGEIKTFLGFGDLNMYKERFVVD